MGNSLFLQGIGMGLLSSAPLGPIAIICIQRTLNKGKYSGFISGMGAAVIDTLYATVAALGLSIIINFFKDQQLYFEIIASVLLLFIGIRILYSRPHQSSSHNTMYSKNLLRDFSTTMVLTLSNPLPLFFFMGAFASFGLMQNSYQTIPVISAIIGVFTGTTAWWFILSSIINNFRQKFRFNRLWWLNKIAGAGIFLFAAFGFVFILLFNH